MFHFVNNNKQELQLNEQNMPKHIAIIMDGNGRWAAKRALPKKAGHRAGAKTLENISNANDSVQIVLSVIKFQLKFMREVGLGLELSHCLKCSSKIKDDAYFSIENGGVTCKDCLDDYSRKIKINIKIIEFLNEILNCDINKPTKYDILVNEKVTTSCFNLLRKYIDIQTGRECKTVKVLEMTKVGR